MTLKSAIKPEKYKITFYLLEHPQWKDSNTNLAMSVCLYTREVVPQFLGFCTHSFLLKKLLINRNRRYRTTIAYSCHTNWMIRTWFCMENVFIWQAKFTKFHTNYSEQCYNIWINIQIRLLLHTQVSVVQSDRWKSSFSMEIFFVY